MSCKQLENLEIIYDDLKKHKKSEIGKILEYSMPQLFKNKKFKNKKLTLLEYNDLLMDEILQYIIKNEKRCKQRKPSITESLKRRSTLKHPELYL